MSGDFQKRAIPLHRAGHCVVPIPKGTKGVHEPGWSAWADTQDEAHVQSLVAKANGCGVGILAKWTPGVDVDVRHGELAQRIAGVAHECLGWTVERIGEAPKVLLPYRTEQPFSKLAVDFTLPGDQPGDKPHKIEILADGQQWVAYHIHPDTGRPYRWPEGDLPRRDALPEIDEQMARDFIERCKPLIAEYGGFIKGESGTGGRSERAQPHPEQRGDLHEVGAALQHIPNNDLDYDGWVRIGMAIKAALGGEGWPLFASWSAQSGKDDPAVTAKKWKSFRPERIGAGTLYHVARENGWARKPRRDEEPREPSGEPQKSDDRPLIRVRGGSLHINAKDAAKVLGAETHAKPFEGVYRRGSLLVRPGRIYNGAELERAGVRRSPGTLTILAADVDYLTLALTKTARWEKFDSRSGKWVPSNAPANVAKSLAAASDQLGYIPVLSGIIEAPTIRADGTLLDRPGYDPATRLLFDPGGVEFPPIPEKPTRAQAETALKMLREPLAEFPFVDEASESVALSKIITGLTRKAMRAAPLHVDTAPKMASGKTLLATIGGYIATGRAPAMMSQAEDPESERKRLLAVLLEGAPLVVIDNIERPLKSDALCSILTEPLFTDRLLGLSKTATAPTNATFVATGNNIIIVGDLTARTIVCALDPVCERPEERRFKLNLHEWVPVHRGDLVAAALTIVRAYLAAGEPMKGKLPNFARFEDWCRFVREPLVWLGMADPCLTRQRIEAADPIREKLTALLAAWAEVFPKAGATVAEAIARAEETAASGNPLEPSEPAHPALREAVHAIAEERGRINPRQLGKFIASHAGRIEGGKRFERCGTRQHAALWAVSLVSLVSGFQPNAKNCQNDMLLERWGTTSPNSPNSPTPQANGHPAADCYGCSDEPDEEGFDL